MLEKATVDGVLPASEPEYRECGRCRQQWTPNSFIFKGVDTDLCPECRGMVARSRDNAAGSRCQQHIHWDRDSGLYVVPAGAVVPGSRECGRVDAIVFEVDGIVTCALCEGLLRGARRGSASPRSQRMQELMDR